MIGRLNLYVGQKAQAAYANAAQQRSMSELIKQMRANVKNEPSAIVINGDLTDMGRKPQYSDYVRQWHKKVRLWGENDGDIKMVLTHRASIIT